MSRTFSPTNKIELIFLRGIAMDKQFNNRFQKGWNLSSQDEVIC